MRLRLRRGHQRALPRVDLGCLLRERRCLVAAAERENESRVFSLENGKAQAPCSGQGSSLAPSACAFVDVSSWISPVTVETPVVAPAEPVAPGEPPVVSIPAPAAAGCSQRLILSTMRVKAPMRGV
ncbi:MAG TPA: hypothetical protein VE982_07540 [Gaiellaceae bacterium]|nr:hypothetical protein [Gaiellaceae bacterium]